MNDKMLEDFGWAVIVDDKIIVNSVAKTRRSAIVNWRLTPTDEIRPIYDTYSDQVIEELWVDHSGDARVVRVRLIEVENQG